MIKYVHLIASSLLFFAWPALSFASGGAPGETLDLTQHWVGFAAIAFFVVAYALVMTEEFTHLRKSKPVILAAGIIWVFIAYIYSTHGMPHAAEQAVRHNILEYAELFLFLLVRYFYYHYPGRVVDLLMLKNILISPGDMIQISICQRCWAGK